MLRSIFFHKRGKADSKIVARKIRRIPLTTVKSQYCRPTVPGTVLYWNVLLVLYCTEYSSTSTELATKNTTSVPGKSIDCSRM